MKTMLSVEGTPEELARVLALIGGADISVCACATKSDAHPVMEMQDAAPVSEAPVEEKPKRTRRTKAEIEAARAEEADAPAASGPTPTAGEQQPSALKAEEVTPEQVRALLVELGKATDGTSAAAKVVIKEQTGRDSFADVTKDELPTLKIAVEAALAGLRQKAA